jgi:hypothetical protein
MNCSIRRFCFTGAIAIVALMHIAFIALLTFETACKAAPVAKKTAPAHRAFGATHTNVSAACNAYLARMKPKIVNNWLLADGKNHVEIRAILHSDGSVSDVTVKSVPNNVLAEQSANEAFAKSEPFEPLPSSISNSANLTIVFDSSADPHGDSDSNITLRLDPIASPQTHSASQGNTGANTSENSGSQ